MPIIILMLALSTITVFAQRHSVTVNVDGAVYECTGGGGSTDPNCVKSVSAWCSAKTSYSTNTCFDKASTGCKGAGSQYSKCVVDTAEYCSAHTSFSMNTCFDKALTSCRGNAEAIRDLMTGAALFADE